MLSGSDCGRVFLWDKWSGRVVNMLMADSHIVNCVQPHPVVNQESLMFFSRGINFLHAHTSAYTCPHSPSY